ncbi:uncharacterized protein LOC131324285 [Rhododendron vialii]|uniref:uncharacterized protein LOC131324285 n=1 Tax=Rhododendron vialii TaxID=182163 RepID=UPI00265DC268|nr:uncharacterized protein LOC131324285 [Rhododendron vialii]
MKSLLLTSPSSVNSTTTTASTASATTTTTTASTDMSNDQSETRDSCYFPKCRKDANCNCEMCLASINATLDLMPKSSLTKNSISKRVPTPRSPISFNPSVMSTPKPSNNPVAVSPPVIYSPRIGFRGKSKRKKRGLGCGFVLMSLVLRMSLVFLAESGFSWAVFRVLKPGLSPEIVRNFGEKSWVLEDVHEKVEFLHREIKSLVNGNTEDCSSDESLWKINRDDLLLNSWCTLYKSTTEEVSIWGWPLQTAGLLTAGFSSRSLTILSGRVTEWSDGKLSYSTRNASETWVQQRWSASVVQLDPNTWILEYRRTAAVENSRIVSAVLEFLKFRLSREVKRMKQEFWLFPAFGNQYDDFMRDSFKVPT